MVNSVNNPRGDAICTIAITPQILPMMHADYAFIASRHAMFVMIVV
jgi:hypothetical protein